MLLFLLIMMTLGKPQYLGLEYYIKKKKTIIQECELKEYMFLMSVRPLGV